VSDTRWVDPIASGPPDTTACGDGVRRRLCRAVRFSNAAEVRNEAAEVVDSALGDGVDLAGYAAPWEPRAESTLR
jgi:hypothetical protein